MKIIGQQVDSCWTPTISDSTAGDQMDSMSSAILSICSKRYGNNVKSGSFLNRSLNMGIGCEQDPLVRDVSSDKGIASQLGVNLSGLSTLKLRPVSSLERSPQNSHIPMHRNIEGISAICNTRLVRTLILSLHGHSVSSFPMS
jgi:hypothetical protein